MTVKKNESEIEDLKAEIAELKKLVNTKPDTAAAKPGKYSMRPDLPPEEGKKRVEAERTGKLKTYRATRNGIDYKQGFIAEGQVFTTDMPQGSWMEDISKKEFEAERELDEGQFGAPGPDIVKGHFVMKQGDKEVETT